MPGARDDFPVARVAALARLRLSPSEADLFQAQLAQVLAFVGQVSDAGTGDADADWTGRPATTGERPDHVAPSLPPDAALGNAPDALESPRLFRVPKVIG
jgi:aspartyl-tRNA(Asn)/glutamyl-tRNA(Gln) amidotransferase subunit C